MSDTKLRLLSLTAEVADPRVRDTLTAASALLEQGFLDSFGLIRLVAEIEREFLVTIAGDDLTSQNFGTVNDIATLVDRYVARAV